MIKSKLRSRNNGVVNGGDDKISNKSTISNFFPKPCEIQSQNIETTRKRKLRSTNNKLPSISDESGNDVQNVSKPKESVKIKVRGTVPISKFFQSKEDDCSIVADFETPKKPKQIIQIKKNNGIPKRKTRKASSMANTKSNKLINKHFFAKDCSEPSVDQTALSHTSENQQKINKNNSPSEKNVNNIMDQFEFKPNVGTCRKTNLNNINSFLVQKQSSKHKWNVRNTALTRRNPQIQLKKLSKAVEQILLANSPLMFIKNNENIQPYFLESDLLRRCHIPENFIFSLNSTANTAKLNQFYINNLFEISTTKCGVLLKDWSIIPGRPSSPEGNAGFFVPTLSNSPTTNKLDESLVNKSSISEEITENLREVVELEPVQALTAINEDVIQQQIAELPGKNNEISEMLISNYALKSYRNINRPRSPDMFDDNHDNGDDNSSEQISAPSSGCKITISGGCVTPSIIPSHTSNNDYEKVSDSSYNSLSPVPSKQSLVLNESTTTSPSSKCHVEKTTEDLLIELYQTGEIFNVDLNNIQTNVLHHIDENETAHEIHLTESQSGVISYEQFSECGVIDTKVPSSLNHYRFDTFQSSHPDNSFFLQNANTTTDAIEFSFDNLVDEDDNNVEIISPKKLENSLIVIESSDDDCGGEVDNKKCDPEISAQAINITQRINEILDHNFDEDPFIVNIDDNCSNDMLNESIRKLVEKNDESFASPRLSPNNERRPQSPISPTTTTQHCSNSLDFEIKHMDKTYQVKTGRNVTPKPKYETMSSPERLFQLHRYGLKPLPHKLAVICLNHIYNQTHPYVECPNEQQPFPQI